MSEKIESLPKWAQGRIASLERSLAYANDRLQQVETKTGPIEWSDHDRTLHLPEGRIQFRVNGRVLELMIRKEGATEYLDVSAHTGSLVVSPRSSNVAWLRESTR